MAKNKGGRPTKLTENFFKVAEKIIDRYVLPCTDHEIIFLINEELPEPERIHENTWKNWKKRAFNSDEDKEIYNRFLSLVKKSLFKEKESLMREMRAGEPGWQAKAWILERKFSEWNLRKISEVDVKANITNRLDEKAMQLIDEATNRQ